MGAAGSNAVQAAARAEARGAETTPGPGPAGRGNPPEAAAVQRQARAMYELTDDSPPRPGPGPPAGRRFICHRHEDRGHAVFVSLRTGPDEACAERLVRAIEAALQPGPAPAAAAAAAASAGGLGAPAAPGRGVFIYASLEEPPPEVSTAGMPPRPPLSRLTCAAPGDNWELACTAAFSEADVIVPLVSPRALETIRRNAELDARPDFVLTEWERALDRADANQCKLVPFFMRDEQMRGGPQAVYEAIEAIPEKALSFRHGRSIRGTLRRLMQYMAVSSRAVGPEDAAAIAAAAQKIAGLVQRQRQFGARKAPERADMYTGQPTWRLLPVAGWGCRRHDANMHDVFISYRVAADEPLARLLALTIEADPRHATVFLDKHCLNDGQNWEDGFLKGLRGARVVILLLSRAAFEPAMRRREKMLPGPGDPPGPSGGGADGKADGKGGDSQPEGGHGRPGDGITSVPSHVGAGFAEGGVDNFFKEIEAALVQHAAGASELLPLEVPAYASADAPGAGDIGRPYCHGLEALSTCKYERPRAAADRDGAPSGPGPAPAPALFQRPQMLPYQRVAARELPDLLNGEQGVSYRSTAARLSLLQCTPVDPRNLPAVVEAVHVLLPRVARRRAELGLEGPGAGGGGGHDSKGAA